MDGDSSKVSPLVGEDEFKASCAKEMDLLEKTGFNMVQEKGLRKYGGPPPGWEGPPPPQGCKVFVWKIPRDMYEDELVPLFERAGRIYELKLMMTKGSFGENRVYAFVVYTNREAAQRAIQMLDNHEIRPGKFIGVCVSLDNCRLFISSIPKDKRKEEIMEEMKKVTEGVVDVILHPSFTDKSRNQGCAFVEYESHEAAATARRRLIPGLSSNQVVVPEKMNAVVGKNITLACRIEEGSNVSVTQISWERRLPSGTITVAMFNPEFGTAISQEYGKRVSFVAPSVRDATINIEGAGFADIGSYICKVVTFPLGIAEASTFVNVLDPTMATPSTSGAGTFVGGAVGGVLFLILLLILGGACFMRQCRTFRVDYYTKQYLGPSDMQTGSQLDMLQPHELQEVYRDKTSKGIQELKPKLGGDIIYPDYTPEDKDRDDWSDRGDAHSGLKEGNYYPDHSNTQNMNSCGPPVHSPIVNNGSPYLPGDCYDNGSDSDYVSYMDGSVISRREWYL